MPYIDLLYDFCNCIKAKLEKYVIKVFLKYIMQINCPNKTSLEWSLNKEHKDNFVAYMNKYSFIKHLMHKNNPFELSTTMLFIKKRIIF